MPKREKLMRDEDILEIRRYWQEGVRINFPEKPTPSAIDNENLYNASWQDLSEEEMFGLRRYPFQLNSVWRRIYLAGWQCLNRGLAVLHPEVVQEDMNLVSGHLMMATVREDRHCTVGEALGSISIVDLARISFVLAISENETGLEYMALQALVNFRVVMPQLSINPGEEHSTMSPVESWYLVLKHSPIGVRL